MKENKNKITWITQSALLIALLVGWQAASSAIPGTIVTGAGVNFILVIAVMVCSLPVALCVAAVSPIMAWLLQIAPPFWVLIPFIASANIAFVLLWYFIAKKKSGLPCQVIALISGAAAKFAVLYAGVVKILVETANILPAPMAIPFSYPQLITASIGGGLAIATVPLLKKALPNRKPSSA